MGTWVDTTVTVYAFRYLIYARCLVSPLQGYHISIKHDSIYKLCGKNHVDKPRPAGMSCGDRSCHDGTGDKQSAFLGHDICEIHPNILAFVFSTD